MQTTASNEREASVQTFDEQVTEALRAIKSCVKIHGGGQAVSDAVEFLRTLMQDRIDELEECVEGDDGDDELAELGNRCEPAIHAVLDEVQRTTGQRDFRVPDTDAARRAILGLYDAIGRNP